MNKRPLFKLIFGLVAVALLTAGLIVYQDRKDARPVASEATISATTYDIGVEYSGVMTQQNVLKGQVVTKGQVLGTLKSGTLMEHLRQAELQPQDLPYTINANSEIELRAANAGIVKSVNVAGGSFVAANQAIYTIIDTSQYYVTSKFTLGTQQLKDLTQGNLVELQLQSGLSLPTRIRDIEIKPADGGKQVVTIESIPVSQLNQASFKLGEPVNTTLILRDQDYWSHITDWTTAQWANVQKLLHR
jgi:multidrug resistance efflux pump